MKKVYKKAIVGIFAVSILVGVSPNRGTVNAAEVNTTQITESVRTQTRESGRDARGRNCAIHQLLCNC
jgi:hypothetical protein